MARMSFGVRTARRCDTPDPRPLDHKRRRATLLNRRGHIDHWQRFRHRTILPEILTYIKKVGGLALVSLSIYVSQVGEDHIMSRVQLAPHRSGVPLQRGTNDFACIEIPNDQRVVG